MDQWHSKFSESFSLDRHWSIECSSLTGLDGRPQIRDSSVQRFLGSWIRQLRKWWGQGSRACKGGGHSRVVLGRPKTQAGCVTVHFRKAPRAEGGDKVQVSVLPKVCSRLAFPGVRNPVHKAIKTDGLQNRKFWGLSKLAMLVQQQFWSPFGWFFGT